MIMPLLLILESDVSIIFFTQVEFIKTQGLAKNKNKRPERLADSEKQDSLYSMIVA